MRNVNVSTKIDMQNPRFFLDSSTLIAGIISSQGASRALLLLSENQKIDLLVSEQVIVEVERNLARKAPKVLKFSREMILCAKITILHDPSRNEVQKHMDWISHPADVSILVAAANAHVDLLVTLNTKHFINDASVANKSGIRIGTPGDALVWIRERIFEHEV